MASLKQLAACIHLEAKFSVLRDFFGYVSAPPWNLANSQNALPQSLSLATQMKRLQQKHFHLNLIRVGTRSNGSLPTVDEQNLDCAVQLCRDIYASIGVGVGRVERWIIPLSDNTGFNVIRDSCEAEDLVDEYSIPTTTGSMSSSFHCFSMASPGIARGRVMAWSWSRARTISSVLPELSLMSLAISLAWDTRMAARII